VRNEEVKDDEVKIERNVKLMKKMMMKQKLREDKIEENNGRN
jgi:hypothetical protein